MAHTFLVVIQRVAHWAKKQPFLAKKALFWAKKWAKFAVCSYLFADRKELQVVYIVRVESNERVNNGLHRVGGVGGCPKTGNREE
jgi:hypothetical protein